MSVYLLVEHDNQSVNPSTFNTLTAGLQLNSQVIAVVAGYNCEGVANSVAALKGVSKVLIADNKVYQEPLAERFVELLSEGLKSPEAVIAPATTFGKNILPRLAATLGVGQVSDVIEIKNKTRFKRPIYAGNAIATVESTDKTTCLTIRVTAFAPTTEQQQLASIERLTFVSKNQQSEFISRESHNKNRPALPSAKVVISGGRGLQNEENFQKMTEIADRLEAAVGASRAAVDSGLAPNDWQVGQTGQVVAPQLYIALGISGAIQHVAGMKDSKIIVAINQDSEAPIFQIADYGLVADVREIFTEWEVVLNEMGY